jgi:two-component system, sensor histidine kinase PdtaS
MDEKMTIAMFAGLIIFLIGIAVVNRFFITRSITAGMKSLEEGLAEKDKTIDSLENEKKQLLGERAEIIKEMHDRVINNLQIVVSLLNTQSYYLKNGAALKAIRVSQQRMYAISLIHHVLNQSEDYSRLNIRNYIYELVESLKDRMGVGGRIHFEIRVENILLDLTRGAPLGLILNEAIANSIAYGFPVESGGTISISLIYIPEENQLLLTISDNGRGFPENQDIDKKDSFGIRLMEGLCSQLGGRFRLDSREGVKIQVSFAYPGDTKTI